MKESRTGQHGTRTQEYHDRHIQDYRRIGPEHMQITNKVKEYVSKPEHWAEPQPGRMCGDGRYEGNNGMLARFGGDTGYAITLLTLNNKFNLGLTPAQIVDAVVNQSEGAFYAHTNCGHTAQAELPKNAEAYAVVPDEVKEAHTYIQRLGHQQPNKVIIVPISGPHLESAVLYNTGDTKIAHRDGDEEYFKVDVKRENEYAQGLFKRLEDALPQLVEKGVDYKDFRDTLDHQTGITAGILAPGLNIYEVNADKPKATVKLIGKID